MNKRLFALGAGIAALVAVAAGSAGAATGKPDGRIKVAGDDFVGNQVFTPPANIDEQSAFTFTDATFVVRVKNRGTQPDTVKVEASGSLSPDASRQIFYQGKDVTAAALAGTLKLKHIAPGASSKRVTIVHDIGQDGSTAVTRLDLTSKNNPGKVDAVRAFSINT